PTRTALEKNLADIEGGTSAYCFGSGMAAIDTIIKLLQPGDEVVATNDLYGGTYRIFMRVYERYGIKFTFTDLSRAENLEKALTPKTKMIWAETPTNPMLTIIDLEAMGRIASKNKALLVVDNTFASPYLQQPIALGADIVVHSATKYLGGHSDVVLGAVICRDETIGEQIKFYQNTCGGVPGPHDCFLVLRGIKTLHVRMDRHSENGMKIARFLSDHPKVAKVHFPGLPTHYNHEVAKRQMRSFGGMMSFSLKGDKMEDALKVLTGTRLFALAESLGGVESLIGHPASMTHAAIPKAEREKSGVVDSLIRLSVGIEDGDDLVADLNNALESI
ncbi:MAG: aminotransferase class I/II-fold pyridoxal phosphate-dependent enzyme, partial [Bacteroidota bacterium]|nr:aminotransferase class I/II-fold pyridoxal phosphate-dependent enzyme [Bacteroidota bacterium]